MIKRLVIQGFLLIMFLPVSSGEQLPVVAVFEIKAANTQLEQSLTTGLSDMLSNRLAGCGYRVIPREQIKQQIRKLQKKSYEKCHDTACQIELGRELAARKSIMTKLTKVGQKCVLSASLYDLKSAATQTATQKKGTCDEDALLEIVDQVADNLCIHLKMSSGKGLAMNPYKKWGHVSFWTGFGLGAFSGLALGMAASEADKHKSGDLSADDKSKAWAGAGFSTLAVGSALMITGVVLWVLSPGDLQWSLDHSVGILPDPDGNSMAIVWAGRW